MLKFINIWALITLALFYLGPIPWPMTTSPDVGLYVLLCLASFNFAYYMTPASLSARVRPTELFVSEKAEYFLIVAYFVLVVTTNYFATQRWMFDPSAYTGGLGDIYDQYQTAAREQAEGVSAAQLPFTFARMLIFPFVLMAFVRNIGKDRLKVAMIGIIFLSSSVFRGTDKEVFDLALILLVGMFYKRLLTRNMLLFGPMVFGAFLLFTERRIGRFGDSLPACLPDGVSCFNFQSGLGAVSETLEIAYVFVSSYLTMGYNALGLTFDLDANWQYGFGHLPPVQLIGCRIFDAVCDANTYQRQLSLVGWDPGINWTSVYPVLANDFTYFGVPLYFLFMGLMLKNFEFSWKANRNLGALCGIMLITQFMLFSSANMQVAASLDWTMSFLAFFYLPVLSLIRPKHGGR